MTLQTASAVLPLRIRLGIHLASYGLFAAQAVGVSSADQSRLPPRTDSRAPQIAIIVSPEE
jgi:hypothetical protein